MRRHALFFSMLLALTILSAAPTSARSPHEVDPATVTPPLGSNLAPFCWEAGSGIICQGSSSETYTNEDFGLRCGDDVIWITGTLTDRLTRWHLADGRATDTDAHQAWQETWTLSPDGSGPSVHVRSRSNRHYTYFVPGEPAQRQLIETGSVVATAAGGGIIYRDAGRITYAIGAGNDFQNPIEFRGPHESWTDWDAALARACEVLGA